MKMIVLDTDCLSLIDRKSGDAYLRLRDKLSKLSSDKIATTIVTFEEQTRGRLAYLSKARSPENQIISYEKLRLLLDNYCQIPILNFDSAAVTEFEKLRKQKIRIGTMDLKIASIAISNRALLVSRNLSDFGQVPNLRVEDWTR